MKGTSEISGDNTSKEAINGGPAKLPRRDWILLPLIGLMTIVLVAGLTELVARKIFYRPPSTNGKCMRFIDPSKGFGAIPNTVCRTETDGRILEYRFNDSGFRAGMESGLKSPGTYRIVMIGSSTAMGLGVPRENSFAALLPGEITQATGRKVELYNEAIMEAHPKTIARWFNEVLDAKPDLILWIVTPYDIQVGDDSPAPEPDPRAGAVAKAMFEVKNRPSGESIAGALRNVWRDYSRTAVLLRHVLDASQNQFMKSYLMGDDISGFLKADPTPLWQSRLRIFDGYAASIGAQAKAAGVPLVVMLLPIRAQVAMVSTGEWPRDYDPYALDRELRAIITSHGGTYIDVLAHFRNAYDLDEIFQTADEHPSDRGHAFLSRIIAGQLTDGAVPALNARAQSLVDQGPAR